MDEFNETRGQPGPSSNLNRREVLSFFWEVIRVVIISLAIIIPIRYYLVQPFFVKGASMEETFHDGDYVLIDEISFRFRSPERGEVVIFRSPQDTSQFFIKRIIGLPGEQVQARNNEIIISNKQNPAGFILNESAYLGSGGQTSGDFKIKLDGNEYFVLGDNRGHSSDSRNWGPLNRSLITGRVFIRAWPFNKISKFKPVKYSFEPSTL